MGDLTQRHLARGIPTAELVAGAGDAVVHCNNLRGVALHPTGQPFLVDDTEREVERFAAIFQGVFAIPTSLDDEESGLTGTTFMAGGVVVFTDRRVVGTIMDGEVLGIRLHHPRDHRAIVFTMAYEDLSVLGLDRKAKVFGGVKDTGLSMWVGHVPINAEIVGETNLRLRGRPIKDLGERFRGLVRVVADVHLARSSDPRLTAHLEAVRGGAFVSNDGALEAVFQPDDEEFGLVGAVPMPSPVVDPGPAAPPAPPDAPEAPEAPAEPAPVPTSDAPDEDVSDPDPISEQESESHLEDASHPADEAQTEEDGELIRRHLDDSRTRFAQAGFGMRVLGQAGPRAEIEVGESRPGSTLRRYTLEVVDGTVVATRADLDDREEPEPPDLADASAVPEAGSGRDALADRLRYLETHFASAGSTFEVVERSEAAAEIVVRRGGLGSRRYRITAEPGGGLSEVLIPSGSSGLAAFGGTALLGKVAAGVAAIAVVGWGIGAIGSDSGDSAATTAAVATTTQGTAAPATTAAGAVTTTTRATTTTAPTTTTVPPLVVPVAGSAVPTWGDWLETGEGCPVEGAYMGDYRYHLGVDLVGDVGDPVLAAADGRVVRVSDNGWGPGNHALIVVHDDPWVGEFTAVYGNLGNAGGILPAGTTVRAGERIGVIGVPEIEPQPFTHIGIVPGRVDLPPGGGFGVGQATCDLWVDTDGDGRSDATGGFVDPVSFLGRTP